MACTRGHFESILHVHEQESHGKTSSQQGVLGTCVATALVGRFVKLGSLATETIRSNVDNVELDASGSGINLIQAFLGKPKRNAKANRHGPH